MIWYIKRHEEKGIYIYIIETLFRFIAVFALQQNTKNFQFLNTAPHCAID